MTTYPASMTGLRSLVASRGARLAVVAFASTLTLAACNTKDADDPLSPTGETGRVRFVTLITDTTRGRVNAILEGVPFGVNLTYTQTTPATLPAPNTANYSAIYTGNRTLVLKRTADTNVVVATIPFTVAPSQDRTIYAIGGAAASAVTSYITTDDNTLPTSAQVRLRVVHLSPTAGAVDVFVTAPGADLAAATPSFTAMANQTASTYLTLAPGTYQVRAVPAGTAAAARAAAVSINLASLAVTGATVRTVVLADNATGGAPLRAFALTDR